MAQALILAGGRGTRLASILNGKPKPLVPINGKPLLQHQIEYLKSYGFDDVIVLVSHEAQQIQDFIDSNSNFGIKIICLDDDGAKGTAGAVIKHINFLSEEFLVVYGDTYLSIDLYELYKFHKLHADSDATIVVHPNDHPQDSDIVEVDLRERVSCLYPYPHPPGKYLPNLVNAALYICKKSLFENVIPNKSPYDFAKNLLHDYCDVKNIYAYNTYEYIKDCGTPERIKRVELISHPEG